MITAILLASGYSNRMNSNKLLLDFHGKPILEWTMAAISRYPFASRLLIQRDEKYNELANKYGFSPIMNPDAWQGQSTSVHTGIRHTNPQSAMMFFVGDQPCITNHVISRLLMAHNKQPGDIIIPTVQGRFKNPVIFPSAFRQQLLAIDGDKGGRSVIKNNPASVRTVAFDEALPFRDIDTFEDYEFLLTETNFR